MAIALDDISAANAVLKKLIINPKLNASQRYVAQILLLALSSKDAQEFKRKIPSVNKKFAAENFSKEARFKLLRQASERLFRAYRFNDVRALVDVTNGMMRPMPEKSFVCEYVKNAPQSADSWSRSPLLNDPRYQESRFEKYACRFKKIKNHLARLKEADMTPLNPNYKTTVYMVYDERGVHIFVKCDDPKAREIEQGLVKCGDLEMYFQPGKSHPYHQWFFSLPGTEDKHLVNWDTPHRNYRLTYDYLTKDSSVTDKFIGAYSFIPWLMVYDKMPSKSNQWIFCMQRSSKGGFVTLGGSVHELGRAVKLKFNMSKEQLLQIKREIVFRAFAKYKKDRKNPDGVIIWKDPILGDPAFFQRKVKPLLLQLDQAGEIVKETMSDEDVLHLFDKFVPQWMELSYLVAELRANYLEQRLLKASKKLRMR